MDLRVHRLRPLVLVPALLLLGTASVQAQLPQFNDGPESTAFWDWDFGMTATTHPTTGAPLNVRHYGRLFYPTNGGGGALPPVKGNGTQRFPLVVFGHGRLQGAPTTGNNHKEATWLLERLATWGVIATSVNLDVVGSFGFPAAIPQRGDIIIDTIRRTLNLGAQPGTPPSGLAASFDGRVILIGHSRGGEGVVSAWLKNKALATPFNVLAVANIAPTDFERLTMDGPYMSLYGSKDGDVNNGWPIMLHDRATSTEKIFEYIYGANHFWFTDTITFGGEGAADIPRAAHHTIGNGYIAGFTVRKFTMAGVSSTPFADGPEMAPAKALATILPMYRHPTRSIMDDFQTNFAVNTSSVGTLVKTKKFTTAVEAQLTGNTLFHETRGIDVTWQGSADAIWAEKTPGATFDASGFDNFSIKVALRQSNALNAANTSQDITIGLKDSDRDRALVTLSAHGDIPYPPNHGNPGRFPIKSVLRTTRIPLSAFTNANPNLDLDKLIYVGWTTNRTNSGELLVDDVEFTD